MLCTAPPELYSTITDLPDFELGSVNGITLSVEPYLFGKLTISSSLSVSIIPLIRTALGILISFPG